MSFEPLKKENAKSQSFPGISRISFHFLLRCCFCSVLLLWVLNLCDLFFLFFFAWMSVEVYILLTSSSCLFLREFARGATTIKGGGGDTTLDPPPPPPSPWGGCGRFPKKKKEEGKIFHSFHFMHEMCLCPGKIFRFCRLPCFPPFLFFFSLETLNLTAAQLSSHPTLCRFYHLLNWWSNLNWNKFYTI